MKKKRSVVGFFYKVALWIFLLSMVLAVSAWGQHLEWAKQAGGADAVVSGNSIAVDEAGNSYVTGHFAGSATFGAGEANHTALTSTGFSSSFVAKFAGDGNLIWARQVGGLGSATGEGIAVDDSGNSYVAGFFSGALIFGPGEVNQAALTSFGEVDIYVAKYAGDGSLLWARQAGGLVSDFAEGIAVDEAGNSYVTGYFYGTATFGPGELNQTVLTAIGDTDIFVAKYAGDGSLLWAKQAGGATGDLAEGIAVDELGNSYVTGGFNGNVIFGAGEPNQTALTSFGFPDVFVANYASNGSLLWAKQAGGLGSSALARDIAIDDAGNSYVTGGFTNTTTFGIGEVNQTLLTSISGDEADIFVAKYAKNGSLLWAKQAGGHFGESIAVDEVGSSYLTGYFFGTAIFGDGEANQTVLTGFGDPDIFVAKYASDGNLYWARDVDGADGDQGEGIAVDSAGNSYVTGTFSDTATFGPGEVNQTVLTSFGLTDIFVAKYGESNVSDLLGMIEGFNLNRGIAKSLKSKLRNVDAALESSNIEQRRNAAILLQSFFHEVEAQRGKALTEEQSDQLISLAGLVLAGLQ